MRAECEALNTIEDFIFNGHFGLSIYTVINYDMISSFVQKRPFERLMVIPNFLN